MLGPIRDHNPSSMSIGSAIFAQLTAYSTQYTVHNGPPLLPMCGRSRPHLMHAVCVCVASVGDGVLQGAACHWVPVWGSWLFRHAWATEAPSGRFSASEVYKGDKRYDAILECFQWVVLHVVWSIWNHACFQPSVSACITDWLPASIVEISGGVIQDVWQPLLKVSLSHNFMHLSIAYVTTYSSALNVHRLVCFLLN